MHHSLKCQYEIYIYVLKSPWKGPVWAESTRKICYWIFFFNKGWERTLGSWGFEYQSSYQVLLDILKLGAVCHAFNKYFLPVATFFVSGISNWSSRNSRQKMVRWKDFLDHESRKRNTAQEKRMDEFNNSIWVCPHPKVKSNALPL